MMRSATTTKLTLLILMAFSVLAIADATPSTVRFATYNASLYRQTANELIEDLETGADAQAKVIAEIIQHVRPDVLLINEFDYDDEGRAAAAFQKSYLAVGQGSALPIDYDYVFVAPTNTGVPSGYDLDNNGTIQGGGDALGYGEFAGQYGMVIFSRFPIEPSQVRTFQNFLWMDLPDSLLPTGWYSSKELEVLPLSSKSHWDVPIEVAGNIIHVLACHPTPPVFDGPEDANGRRNHDEIGFWARYVDPQLSSALYDDAGQPGGLKRGDHFVVMGDLNADPFDGDSTQMAILQLLESPWITASPAPASLGAVEQATLQGRANRTHEGDPAHDTADFSESTGNLRADYVLPSATLTTVGTGVFWPLSNDPLFSLVGTYPFPGSDHRLVWVDIALP